MADSKWIAQLAPETPVAEAARRVLLLRLGAVCEQLPLAVKEADRDPEHVHQLRVATRRAGAALDIFAPCLPEKAYRRTRKFLKRLRRAAGAARDWDVFLEDLGARLRRARAPLRPGLDFLLGYGSGQRAAAQAELERTGLPALAGAEGRLAETLAAVRPPESVPVAVLQDLARLMLRGLLAELEAAAGQDLGRYEHLHRVRILGKRLRYAMELFGGCFPGRFRTEYYPAVEQMQEMLGRANDSFVAAGRLEALQARLTAERPKDWRRFRAGIESLLQFHRRRLPQERGRFLRWWRNWRRSGLGADFAELVKESPSPAS